MLMCLQAFACVISLYMNKDNNILFYNRHTQLICYISLISLRTINNSFPNNPLFLKLSSILENVLSLQLHVPTIWNQFPIAIKQSETTAIFRKHSKYICLKLLFHHECSVTSCSNDDFCLSPFMITPKDFVCFASELEFSMIQALQRSVNIIYI